MIVTVFLSVITAVGVYFPSPHDKHRWGLRIHGLSNPGPFLAKEFIGHYQIKVSLINFSKKEQFHDPLPAAYQSRALDVILLDPDGEEPHDGSYPQSNRGGRNPFTVQSKALPGGVSSLDFNFLSLGYSRVFTPGRHRIEAKFEFVTDGKLDGRVVKSPSVEFEVLPLKAETILSSHQIPLEGREAKLPPEKQPRQVVQQVKVGEHTLLIYRRYYSQIHAAQFKPEDRPLREIAGTHRLAELPGKCEITVEGAFGDWKPLTITYKTSPTADPIKLRINSVDGRPWTNEEEQELQERLKREGTISKKP